MDVREGVIANREFWIGSVDPVCKTIRLRLSKCVVTGIQVSERESTVSIRQHGYLYRITEHIGTGQYDLSTFDSSFTKLLEPVSICIQEYRSRDLAQWYFWRIKRCWVTGRSGVCWVVRVGGSGVLATVTKVGADNLNVVGVKNWVALRVNRKARSNRLVVERSGDFCRIDLYIKLDCEGITDC